MQALPMLRHKLFDGIEKTLTLYNQKAILDLEISFYTEECDDDLEEDEEDFTFPGYVSSYMRVYNERLGHELKDLALSQSGSSLIVNASVADATFRDNGNYYYEIGYVQSGGYEIALMYGILKVI